MPRSQQARAKRKVLFLCTGNSCRSQMAEGFANSLCKDRLEARSAGTHPQKLNPLAVRVMAEVGINIAQAESKNVAEFYGENFDLVVTVCDDARESCPLWAKGGETLHHRFDDPPRLASAVSDEEQILGVYRRVRDEIKAFVLSLPDTLDASLS